MLELYGLQLRREDQYNWGFYWKAGEDIIIVPKQGDLISLEIMENILNKLKVDTATFFDLKKRAEQAP